MSSQRSPPPACCGEDRPSSFFGGVGGVTCTESPVHLGHAIPASSSRAQLTIVGSKARDGLQRTHGTKIKTSIDETYTLPITFSLASFLAEQMLAEPADEYTILYNKFNSVISFDVVPYKLKGPEALGESGVFDEFEFEGEKEDILANMYQFNLACALCTGVPVIEDGLRWSAWRTLGWPHNMAMTGGARAMFPQTAACWRILRANRRRA